MSASTAIGMVGESLKNLLDSEMSLSSTVNTTILAPDESTEVGRVNLFLYKIKESPYQKNMDWRVSGSDPSRISPPPLTLSLYYLMTAYALNDAESGNTNAHAILGEAMRVLHQHPIIPETHLVAGLTNAAEQIKLMQVQIDMEELSKIWSTFSEPFRLSALYEVSVVQLDQSADQDRDMPARVREIGVPSITQPYLVPKINEINPVSAIAGANLTISGENLVGWNAYVSVSGEVIADALPLDSDSFVVSLPALISPGFHSIRIDISRITRMSFFVEVTP